jgi:hypothetical protein
MSQERKSFTVNDRRQFTPEGERREDAEVPPAPAPPPAAAGERGGEKAPSADSIAEFGPFVLSLAAQASYLLASKAEAGEGEPAEAGERLEEARHLISILEMLKDKTEGRRTSGEDRILDGVLYELRMAYVARTRAGGA